MPQQSEFRPSHQNATASRRSSDLENRSQRGAQRVSNQEDEPEASDETGEGGPICHAVQSRPLASVMTSVGLGFGFGLVVTLLLSRPRQSWFERNMPEPIQHLPDRLKRVPESLASYVPSSWKYS